MCNLHCAIFFVCRRIPFFIFLGMSFNFNKQPADKINSMGTPYDYRSMMHYGKTAFGRGKTTIRTKQSYYQDKIGQRSGFSEIDKKQINLMYCQ